MKRLENAFCGSSEINYRIHVVAAIVAAAAGAWIKLYLLWLLVKKMPGHQGRATI